MNVHVCTCIDIPLQSSLNALQAPASRHQVSGSNSVQLQLISLMQTLVAQHQQGKQQQQQQQQQQKPQQSQDLSSAITQKAEEILQMQTSLPQTSALLPSCTGPGTATHSTASSATCSTSSTAGTTASLPSSVTSTDISEGAIQAAILDNLFVNQPQSGASNSSRLFQTSSDTVNQLLRGLSTGKSHSDSIHRLSRETASVLPTFAKALESSVRSHPPTSGPTGDNNDETGEDVEDEGGVDDGSKTPLSGTQFYMHVYIYAVTIFKLVVCTCTVHVHVVERMYM